LVQNELVRYMPKGIPFQAKIRFILKAKLPSRRADRTSFLAFWGDSSFSAHGSLRQGPGLPTRIVFEWERHEVIRSGGERNRLIEGQGGEGLPAVDLPHSDLARREQRSEQHPALLGRLR
jgi:hypothetical protein